MFGGTIHSALVHAATVYDRRQARGKRYNQYALAQYLKRISDVEADIAAGASPREAIIAGFAGSLRAAMLKAIEAMPATLEEERNGAMVYVPVVKNDG